MKKTVVIWSSPNKDGLTASAKDRFIEGLKETAEVEEIWLNKRISNTAEPAETDGAAATRRAVVSSKTIFPIYTCPFRRQTA